eukprot:TRINITY_DN80990_c0_g1_i1.p1 TRINITY_DN80990_c0_g1~~TRINITY_DN80990_c0_g1_i1.p1  ORF type:complete len:104 (-),score=20.14 TRINITY_DN80990_c0_g1_i1:57-368(-)
MERASRLELTKAILTYRSGFCSHNNQRRVSLLVVKEGPCQMEIFCAATAGTTTEKSINGIDPHVRKRGKEEGERDRQAPIGEQGRDSLRSSPSCSRGCIGNIK